MFPKIGLTAAFLLMVAPPWACASQPGTSIAKPTNLSASTPTTACSRLAQLNPDEARQSNNQDNDSSTDNDNDNNSNDTSGDNQNGDQMNNADNDQPVPPTILGGSDDNNSNDNNQVQMPPMNAYPQQVNPYQ